MPFSTFAPGGAQATNGAGWAAGRAAADAALFDIHQSVGQAS